MCMKAEKVKRWMSIGSFCLLLGGCAGVHAGAEETEPILYETEYEDGENIPELESSENVDPETELKSETEEESEAKSEFESEAEETERAEILQLEYKVEDQNLEIGKCFADIVVPNYAMTEKGDKVTGQVEWRVPGDSRVFDKEIALGGVEGEKKIWEWTFVPDDTVYESLSGTVEITMQKDREEESGSLADLANLWKDHGADKTSHTASASGSSIGASNTIKVSDLQDIGKWMGSLLTGAEILGDKKDGSVKEIGKGTFTVVHGTVKREESKNQAETESSVPESEKEMMPATSEAGDADTETAEPFLSAFISGTEQTKHTERSYVYREREKKEALLPAEMSVDHHMNCRKALKYGKFGMAVFAHCRSRYWK